MDLDSEPGLADNGDLEHDLKELVDAAGAAAEAAGTALALFIDDLHHVEARELAALVAALHRAAQKRRPVILIGAGLPKLRSQVGHAKPYAERMFDFREIGSLLPSVRTAMDPPIA